MAVITQLIKTNRNKGNMYKVFLDDEEIGLFHIEALVKNGAFVGKEFEPENLKQIMFESNKLVAMEQSIKYLAKALKTEKELRDNLRSKGYEDKIIDDVVLKLKEYDYIDDLKYALAFVNSATSKGPYRLKFELKLKGISDEIIEEALADLPDDSDNLQRLANRYLKGKELNQKTFSKLYQYLMGRGFESDKVASIINKLKDDTLEE